MSTYAPAYKLSLYAPRSVDASEATVLTPRAGAAHADAFTVATVDGVAGAKPYLLPPRGRRARLDVRERVVDTGELTFPLIDKRLAGDNVTRWVTAFVGDAKGAFNLLGLKAKAWESLDGGDTWAPFFTGRVEGADLDGKAVIALTVRGLEEELGAEVFANTPHDSITYAFRPSLLPLGLPSAWGPFPATRAAEGTVTAPYAATPGARRLVFDAKQTPWTLRLKTQALLDAARWHEGDDYKVFIEATNLTTGATGWYATSHGLDGWVGHTDPRLVEIASVLLEELPATHPKYLPLPAVGNRLAVRYRPATPVTPRVPLLITDVHPVVLLRDLVDGKFGPLDPSTGAVLKAFARDTSGAPGNPWVDLAVDPTFPLQRYVIEKAERLNEFMESVCRQAGLAYRIDGDGRIVLVDLRRRTAVSTASTITDADLAHVPGNAGWNQTRRDAVTQVDVTYYHDAEIAPADLRDAAAPYGGRGVGLDVPIARIASRDDLYRDRDLSLRTIDLGERKLELDARGIRSAENERTAGVPRREYVERVIRQIVADAKGPFIGGAQYAYLTCRRTANAAAAVPGTWHVVDVDALPDPATGLRGGPRLMLCTDREEDGPRLRLDFLDAGANSVAVPPTLSGLAADAGDPYGAVAYTVTLNASGERVVVQAAVTATSEGTRPAETSELWAPLAVVAETGARADRVTAAGQRVWLRARTESGEGDKHQLPSAWAFPSGAGYADLSAVGAPTALAVPSATVSTATITFTPADATSEVEVLLWEGGVPTWEDHMVVRRLTPGSTGLTLTHLKGPSTTYGLAVRHRRPDGQVSAVAQTTFATSATPAAVPRPAGLAVR